MKNVATLKSTKTESPKTPGGISKSLLTPCRRVGLSRNWKKAGPSPFISPLSGSTPSSTESKTEKKETRKRKERIAEEDEVSEEIPHTPVTVCLDNENVDECDISVPSKQTSDDIDTTPIRHIEIQHKKRSKLLSNTTKEPLKAKQGPLIEKEKNDFEDEENKVTTNAESDKEVNKPEKVAVSTPVRLKSLSKSRKRISPRKPCSSIVKQCDIIDETSEIKENLKETPVSKSTKEENSKQKSPNELTKECIVVIQKKIFKTDKKKKSTNDQNSHNEQKPSQTLLDSDSDDVPLSNLNKKPKIETKNVTTDLDSQGNENNTKIDVVDLIDDDDFTETTNVKVKKLADKNTSTSGLKPNKVTSKKNLKTNKTKTQEPKPLEINSASQSSNSFDEDDDFEFDKKRTILIRKSYDKVTKPLKAKTTGSITQRDIDELKERIESKKKLLLAKAVTEDTEELRTLIKKWQKGCQDALMELMDLMKTKFPDRKNMDYSEILQSLKIPATLVGYDSDNDCFNTPDDASIVLSKFNY